MTDACDRTPKAGDVVSPKQALGWIVEDRSEPIQFSCEDVFIILSAGYDVKYSYRSYLPDSIGLVMQYIAGSKTGNSFVTASTIDVWN
jgi:hypothetical protein